MKTSKNILNRLIFSLVGSALLSCMLTSSADAEDASLGGGSMQLSEGYTHKVLQGICNEIGEIKKEGGLKISYSIGSLPPGMMGGSFTDSPKNTPKNELRWYREQTVNGLSVHLAHCKDDLLLVSFPQRGVNFRVSVKSTEEMAEALLMILTYSATVPKPSKRRTPPCNARAHKL